MSGNSRINYWKVPREWAGQTAFILGGGPSLRGFDAEVLRGRKIIAVNNSWEMAPWSEVLYFCDEKWWRWHGDKVTIGFCGRYIVTPAFAGPLVKTLRLVNLSGLDRDPTAVRSGHNSGYQAINLAYHFGARRIILLGIDMTTAPDGATHYHEGHPISMPRDLYREMLDNTMKKNMLPYFPSLGRDLELEGVEVINANPASALTYWPRKPLSELL